LLVQFESETDPRARDILLQKLNRVRAPHVKRPFNDLTVDQFKQISEWYHSAILELADVADFEFTPANIAGRLGISKLDAEVALERLSRLELLHRDENGKWKRIEGDLLFTSPVQNAALRSFYRQMMEKASEALEEQTPDERVSGYETLTFSKEALPEA